MNLVRFNFVLYCAIKTEKILRQDNSRKNCSGDLMVTFSGDLLVGLPGDLMVMFLGDLLVVFFQVTYWLRQGDLLVENLGDLLVENLGDLLFR